MCLAKLMKKSMKKMKCCDLALIKLSVFFGALFLVTAWVGFRNMVFRIDWYWHLALMVVFGAMPLKRMLID